MADQPNPTPERAAAEALALYAGLRAEHRRFPKAPLVSEEVLLTARSHRSVVRTTPLPPAVMVEAQRVRFRGTALPALERRCEETDDARRQCFSAGALCVGVDAQGHYLLHATIMSEGGVEGAPLELTAIFLSEGGILGAIYWKGEYDPSQPEVLITGLDEALVRDFSHITGVQLRFEAEVGQPDRISEVADGSTEPTEPEPERQSFFVDREPSRHGPRP